MTLTAAACPVASATTSTPSAPPLASAPGSARISVGVHVTGPADVLGMFAHRVGDGAAPLPGSARTSPCTARASPVSDSPNSGAPQPSTATWARLLPRQLLDDGADPALHGVVGVEVGVDGPAGGHGRGEHRGVLARAVHPLARGRPAAPDQPVPGGLVLRPVRAGSRARRSRARPRPSISATSRTWKSSPVWLPAAIARRGPCRAAPATAGSRAPGTAWRTSAAAPARAHPARGRRPCAVGREADGAAEVDALDEPGAHHLGEHVRAADDQVTRAESVPFDERRGRSAVARACAGRRSGGSSSEYAGELGQGRVDHQVDQRDDEVGLDEQAVVGRQDLAAVEQLGVADHEAERGVLQQADRLADDRGQHPAGRLRQHDQAHRPAVGEADREARLALAALDGPDPGAEDLRERRRVRDRQRHHELPEQRQVQPVPAAARTARRRPAAAPGRSGRPPRTWRRAARIHRRRDSRPRASTSPRGHRQRGRDDRAPARWTSSPFSR